MVKVTEGLRGCKEFILLYEKIASVSLESEIFYCPSPGNWGDALINYGTSQFFEFYNLPHSTVNREEVLRLSEDELHSTSGSILIVGGGGGWCENWSSTKFLVESVANKFIHVIILPTTYELSLIEDSSNITYFSRALLPPDDNNLNVYFCHDMAFFIELETQIQTPPLWRLIAFRGDKEKSPDSFNHLQQIDISLLGNSFSSVNPFFEIINRFELIYTDRLHVGIAASLLNIRCALLPGNYAKTSDVWESSIKDKYPKTQLLSWTDARPRLLN